MTSYDQNSSTSTYDTARRTRKRDGKGHIYWYKLQFADTCVSLKYFKRVTKYYCDYAPDNSSNKLKKTKQQQFSDDCFSL